MWTVPALDTLILFVTGTERDGCWCTHVCFIHASVKASTKAMMMDIPRAYLASA